MSQYIILKNYFGTLHPSLPLFKSPKIIYTIQCVQHNQKQRQISWTAEALPM